MTKSRVITLTILILAIVVGAFLRFYKLGESPSGFYLDEVAMGYDAFSILKTGKDEFAMPYPIIFRSFLDFKTPIYTYLIVPLIPLFDLTPFTVRFPSAFFGVLTLPLLFVLLKKITEEKYGSSLALIATIFLSISPWHIVFSRTAYETNIALFFLLLGSFIFYHSLQKPWLFVLASLALATSFTAYHAERLVVPILLIALAITFQKNLLSKIKTYLLPVILSFLVGLYLTLPTLKLMQTPGFLSRATTLNIFSYTNQMPWGYKISQTNLEHLLNTPQLLSLKEFASLYTSYFSPRYLFSIGDAGPRSSYPDFGTFFVWQFPLYLIGLYFLIKDEKLVNLKVFVFTLLLASPIPAALTRDPYTTIRSLPMVIPLTVIMAYGLLKVFKALPPKISQYKYLIVIFLLLISTTKLTISIFKFNDFFRAQHWDFGWKQVINNFADFDPKLPIIVDNSRGEAYIHLLFFLKYSPEQYQKDNFEVSLSQYYTSMQRNKIKNLGNITVKNFQWGIDTDTVEKYLIVDEVAISEVQYKDHHMTLIDEIFYPNKNVAFRILKTNPKQ